jgi:hypothetical protein
MQQVSAETFAGMVAGLESSGLKPVDIQRLTGLSHTTYYRLRNGEALRPQYDTVVKLVELHGQRVPPAGLKTR